MIDLNKEAEEYSNKIWGGYVNDVFKHDDIITDKTLKEITITDFIAGANSKYVKQQILLAKIDALRNIAGDDDEHTEKRRVLHITRFQQELKQLQDVDEKN